MSVVIHHLNNSRSQRILWLLEELEVPYELKRYERDAKTMRAPDSLTKIHPLGKSPVLEHGGRTFAETGAIVEYILDELADGALRPEAGTEAFYRYRFFLHYAEGSLMTPLLVKLIMGQLRDAPVPFFLKPIMKGVASKVDSTFTDPELKKNMTFLNEELKGREWFAGELSGADIMLSFPLEAAGGRVDLSRYPNIQAFVKRVQARPAYARGLERGGPYDYA
ncbi:MAG: glutathione S-transferase [Polyangiales bacterium]|jgi:glutathione S-transferase